MSKREVAPVTPGEMLQEEFLGPMGLTMYALAKAIDVPQTRISEIVKGTRSITPETDLRLCRFFGLSDGWWARVQLEHDIAVARDEIGDRLEMITPYSLAA